MYDATLLKDGVFWVGAIDWYVRDLHGHTPGRGTTYHAYLVKGERTAFVDTVKAEFFHEMVSRIESVQDPKKIDCLVVNHLEMDHSGALSLIKELVPNAEIIATDDGSKGWPRHFRHDCPLRTVKTGTELALEGETI